MSAFMVNKRHVDFLVTAGLRLVRPPSGAIGWFAPAEVCPETHQRGAPWGPAAQDEASRRRRELTRETASLVGAMLWAENRRSVDHRYDEEELEDCYEFAEYHGHYRQHGEIKPVDVLSALRCYEYQSCEHPEWEASEAHAFCEALRQLAIRSLHGYSAGPWEVTK